MCSPLDEPLELLALATGRDATGCGLRLLTVDATDAVVFAEGVGTNTGALTAIWEILLLEPAQYVTVIGIGHDNTTTHAQCD